MYWKKIFSLISALVICIALAGTVWAETHTEFVTGNPIYQPVNDHAVYIISNTLDFADLTTVNASGGTSGVTNGDVVQLLDIPAGTIVKNIGARIYSAWSTSGATMAGVTIGDGTDPNGWITAFDFGAEATGVSNSNGAYVLVTTDFDTGKYYSAADTIDAVIPSINRQPGFPGAVGGATDFQLQIWAECVTPSVQNAYGKLRP